MTYNYSVVLPFRNDLKMLYTALASIPDRQDIQILIVDNSAEPLQKDFVSLHHTATVLYLTSSPTGGAGCARNVGMASAEGRWLVFLDADDYFTQEAFEAFDRYMEAESDIVFFDMTAVYIGTNEHSPRLDYYSQRLAKNDTNLMRYRSANPVGKMIKRSLVEKYNIQFQEVRVSNDTWFSLLTGYYAQTVSIDPTIVYCATESAKDGSLMKTVNPENSYTRYCVAMQCNQFLKKQGLAEYRGRLLAMTYYALKNHGIGTFAKFILKAVKERENLFTGLTKNDK